MIEKNLHICVVTIDYPGNNRSEFTFVEQLVLEFASLGVRCTVIAPFSITKSLLRIMPFDRKYQLIIKEENRIEIYRPRYISFSNFKLFGISLSAYFHKCAVNKTLNKLKVQPDVLYSHFWASGIECYNYALNKNIPLFIATGESIIHDLNAGRKFKLPEFRDYVSGVICVSEKNRDESIEKGLTTADKCIVLPNGVDLSKFYKKDQRASRKLMGYSTDDFIVVFVGHFDERKGTLRLSSAINILNDPGIRSIFIGNGPMVPDCDGILFRGKVSHDNISDYLNCADVFVLLTLHEGCSNAIIEAMACGLPIISSDLAFNKDILDDGNSIRVDPNNIRAIADAVKEIKENPQKRKKALNPINPALRLSPHLIKDPTMSSEV